MKSLNLYGREVSLPVLPHSAMSECPQEMLLWMLENARLSIGSSHSGALALPSGGYVTTSLHADSIPSVVPYGTPVAFARFSKGSDHEVR